MGKLHNNKVMKLFVSLFVIFSICFTSINLFPMTVHAAPKISDDTGDYTGNHDAPRGSGYNYWVLIPHRGNNLALDICIGNTANGSCMIPANNGGKWEYSSAKSAARISGFHYTGGIGLSETCRGTDFIICSTRFQNRGSTDFNTLAANLNAANPGLSVTGSDIEDALNQYFEGKVTNQYVYGSDGNRLVTIYISDLFEITHTDPVDPPPVVNNTQEDEYKWVLMSLTGVTTGTKYERDSEGLDEWTALHSFSESDYKANILTNPKTAWFNTPGSLSYPREIHYAVDSQNTSTAKYMLLHRYRYWIVDGNYGGSHSSSCGSGGCGRGCTRHWMDTSHWSDWYYYFDRTADVTNTGNAYHDVEIPEYLTDNWIDLTTEQFTHDSNLVTGSGVKPIDYKDALDYSNDNLSITLTSGKTPGDMFEILSDNNPKPVELYMNGIFGVEGIPTTRTSTVGDIYLVKDQFFYGPQQMPQGGTPLISIQRTSPTLGIETWDRDYITYGGSTVDFIAKYRSIKYGVYTLGDGRGSNYWYDIIRLAAINQLGTKYEVYAEAAPSTPSPANVHISSSDLHEDIAISASFIQPVLVGDINVMDAAGN